VSGARVRCTVAIVGESAERDKLLSEIEVKISKEYFMKRYNLGEGVLV